MADATGIEWTEATWNPVTGCDKVSPGCKFCYAEKMSQRLKAMGTEKYKDGFAVRTHEDVLDKPTGWRKPRRIFVNSMSDLFHPEVPARFIEKCFDVMRQADHHVYQILTKRPERMAEFGTEELEGSWPSQVWAGTSVENSEYKHRVDQLRDVPASIRFLSIEPLIGPVGDLELDGIDWVIVGGESGPQARDIEIEWVRSIRDQCLEAGVAFFFKQWGGRTSKAGGRELDGRTWEQFPGTQLDDP